MKKSRRHALGQHFLSDRGTLHKIVKTIQPAREDFIIEVGGGRGILTRPLAEKAGRVLSIEIDDSLVPVLRSLGLSNLEVIAGDVLQQDFSKLAPAQGAKLVGNLPYSISGPLIIKILFERRNIFFCVFLIQKEVAVRICAGPGGKDYAPLSILLHNAFERKLEFKVKPGAFSPPPKVDSAVISLKKRSQTLVPIPDDRRFLGFLRGCFRHRRKTLTNNLKGLGYSTEAINSCLIHVDQPGNARAEELTLEQFFSISQELGFWQP
jgi:16S rRNA (adenine1518-N6/adenine1519-N6)-dimethyltransferase